MKVLSFTSILAPLWQNGKSFFIQFHQKFSRLFYYLFALCGYVRLKFILPLTNSLLDSMGKILYFKVRNKKTNHRLQEVPYVKSFQTGKELDFVRRCKLRLYHADLHHHPHLLPLAGRAAGLGGDRLGHLGTGHLCRCAHSGGSLPLPGSSGRLPRHEKTDVFGLFGAGHCRAADSLLHRQLDLLYAGVCADPSVLQRLQHLL